MRYMMELKLSFQQPIVTRCELDCCTRVGNANNSLKEAKLTSNSGFKLTTTVFVSKSQIVMPLPVAAHNQYRLGEKHRELTVSFASREYKCLASFKSHNMVTPSLPPVAHSEPSGEMATVEM